MGNEILLNSETNVYFFFLNYAVNCFIMSILYQRNRCQFTACKYVGTQSALTDIAREIVMKQGTAHPHIIMKRPKVV